MVSAEHRPVGGDGRHQVGPDAAAQVPGVLYQGHHHDVAGGVTRGRHDVDPPFRVLSDQELEHNLVKELSPLQLLGLPDFLIKL